ncbi:MAG: acyl dehydratase [Bermanella sp.]|jgi:acyl dehydratase
MPNDLHFHKQPSMPGLLLRAAITRKSANASGAPQLNAHLEQLQVNTEKLQRYNSVCGFDTGANFLPATYPHIAAFSLQMEMLLHKSFPFSPIGMVHTRNRISQFRPISASDQLALSCSIGDSRDTDIGLEVDILTEASAQGETVWTELGTMLKLNKSKTANAKPAKKHAPLSTYDKQEQWSLASNLGRRYARVSGDFNPIHLFPASAKLLGFKRHIAHGMWSKARCLAALQAQLNADAFCIDVEFKTPLFLPADVSLHYSRAEGGIEFSLRNAAGTRPHVNGTLTALTPD